MGRPKRNLALDIMAIRRRINAGEEWTAVGNSVIVAGERVGRMRDDETARLVCDLHNSYLILANGLIMLQKRLLDNRRRYDG